MTEIDAAFKRRLLVARVSAAAISFVLAVSVSLVVGALWEGHQRYQFRVYTCQTIERIKAQIVLTVDQGDRNVDDFVGRIPGYTQADADRAHRANAATRNRFRPLSVSCETFAKI